MKLRIATSELSRALYRVQGIIDRRGTMPALAHVLFVAAAEGLVVAATDSDICLSGSYAAEVTTPGSVAIAAKQLFDIVRALSAPQVELEVGKNHWTTLRAGASRFNLVGMAADDFPELALYEDIDAFPLGVERLMAMVERTLFCVSTDESRHHLGGIYCETPKPSTLRMVSTDGHRLALAEGQFDTTLRLEGGVIVPRKAFVELKRIVGDRSPEARIQVGFTANAAVFRLPDTILSTRLIEGQFPHYQQVIPEGSDKRAVLKVGPFAEALRRVSLLSGGRAHGVRCTFADSCLTMVAEDPEMGEAEESLEMDYRGPTLTVGFNARYILDVLPWVGEEAVVFELADELSPGILRPNHDASFLAIVMPMRF